MEEKLDTSTWSIRDVMDGSFRMYRKHFLSIWFFSFLINTPYLLWYEWRMYEMNTTATIKDQIILYIVGNVITFMFLFPLLQNGLVTLIHNQKVTVKSLFKTALHNGWKVLLANGLISTFYIFCLSISILIIGVPYYMSILETSPESIKIGSSFEFIFYLCHGLALLPWAYIIARFSLVIPFLNYEKRPFWNAFKESSHWVKKDAFRVLGAIIILSLIQFMLLLASTAFVEQLILDLLKLSDEMVMLYSILYQVLASAFFAPIIPLFCNLLYMHYHRRRSGADLILLLERIDQRSRSWTKRASI